jgi:hypothetical protein
VLGQGNLCTRSCVSTEQALSARSAVEELCNTVKV